MPTGTLALAFGLASSDCFGETGSKDFVGTSVAIGEVDGDTSSIGCPDLEASGVESLGLVSSVLGVEDIVGETLDTELLTNGVE